MQDSPLFELQQQVRFSDCDARQELTPASLFRMLIEAAGAHYAAHGFDHRFLEEHGFAFLVTRVGIDIDRLPRAEETVTLQTWERPCKGVRFYRDFILTGENGDSLLRASSEWVVSDPVTHKIIHPKEFPYRIELSLDRSVGPEERRISSPAQPEQGGNVTVNFYDLDGNGHVNNSVYIDLACRELAPILRNHSLSGIRAIYHRELMEGDRITFSTATGEDEIYIAASPEEKPCFEALFRLNTTK
ncbi:MAG: hypothetical protein IJY82_00465 [Oscillospiraceae bacterium]|nr:hypothetical protein [Oscillospiraceae bacterium]